MFAYDNEFYQIAPLRVGVLVVLFLILGWDPIFDFPLRHLPSHCTVSDSTADAEVGDPPSVDPILVNDHY